MRRNRGAGSSSSKGNGAAIPDSLSMIRSFNLETNPTRPARPSPLTASTIPDMPLDLVDRIRSFPLFLSAPDTFLAAILKHLRPQVASNHDHILTEGDEAKSMYWLVRGAVAVTSRDGEATYAELKPGAFFGEIGILMDVPRTATIIARSKCLLVVLKKEDLRAELPNFPEMEKAIREEAQERLTILNKKRKESGFAPTVTLPSRGAKLAREAMPGEVSTGDMGSIEAGTIINHKKRKSPSPGIIEDPAGEGLGSGLLNIRQTLKDLPLFSTLPQEILHFLGLSVESRTYPPFTDIIKQGSPGNEIYFIIKGEAEVIHEPVGGESPPRNVSGSNMRPRLKQGQYFGEVASLALAPRRTATVRSISTVECLIVTHDTLEELWRRCSPDIRAQVEATARKRYVKPVDEDVIMTDADSSTPSIHGLEIADRRPSISYGNSMPQMTFTKPPSPSLAIPSVEYAVVESIDQDPFRSVSMEDMRTRTGRRASLAPLLPEEGDEFPLTPQPRPRSGQSTKAVHLTTPPDSQVRMKRPRTVHRRPSQYSRGILPDKILVKIFSRLDIYHLMRLRSVSLHWSKLLGSSPDVIRDLDLSAYNRFVTNKALVNHICPFVGNRPWSIDLSNCFHVTDEGFNALVTNCGQNVRCWKMKSVWDITANSILEMANNAKDLEEVDLSNCRKVSDNLLARIVGWVVTDSSQMTSRSQKHAPPAPSPPVGTVVGCPKLKNITLSYCKHVTDRSMAHLAVHAHSRLQSMDLTRCTTITDNGFQHWSIYKFTNLEKLILADCTYLTDNAIVYLTNAAKGLKELDLVGYFKYKYVSKKLISSPVFLLRSVRHSHRSSVSRMSSTHPSASLILRLCRLRQLLTINRAPSLRTEGSLCARLRPRYRSRCRSYSGGLLSAAGLRRQPVQEPDAVVRWRWRGEGAETLEEEREIHYREAGLRRPAVVAGRSVGSIEELLKQILELHAEWSAAEMSWFFGRWLWQMD